MSNTDQAQNEYFEAQAQKTSAFFDAKAASDAEYFAEQTRRTGDFDKARLAADMERARATDNQKVFQIDTKQWGRDELTKVEPAFRQGDKIQADFPASPASDSMIALNAETAISRDGAVTQEVHVEAVIKLDQQQFQSAFNDYGNTPQDYLQGHAGKTPEGIQKAVVVESPNREPMIVIPREDGSVQQVGFNPKPSQQAFQQPAQAPNERPVAEQPLTQAGFKPAHIEPAARVTEQAAPSAAPAPARFDAPAPSQSASHNSWGADGISERWNKFETDQKQLKRDIDHQSNVVGNMKDTLKAFTKDNEMLEDQRGEFLDRTQGLSNQEIARDPELAKMAKQFNDYDKKLGEIKKDIKREEKVLGKQQDEFAINHCKFHSDSWARVRTVGECIGSKEMIDKANSMQAGYKNELHEIRERQANEDKSEEIEMSNNDEPQVDQAEQALPDTKQFSSLSTDQYIAQEIQAADKKGEALEKGGLGLTQNALDDMDEFSSQADQALKELEERKQAQTEKKALSR